MPSIGSRGCRGRGGDLGKNEGGRSGDSEVGGKRASCVQTYEVLHLIMGQVQSPVQHSKGGGFSIKKVNAEPCAMFLVGIDGKGSGGWLKLKKILKKKKKKKNDTLPEMPRGNRG